MTLPPLSSETRPDYMVQPHSLYLDHEGVDTHAYYQFSYTVNHQQNQFGHQESRDDGRVSGEYHVLLPGGTRQVVMYYADDTGYHPTVTYEDAYDIDPRSVRDPLQALSTLTPLRTGPAPNTLHLAAFITPLPPATHLRVNTVSTEHQNFVSENPLLSNLSREARLVDEADVLRQYSPNAFYLGSSSDFVYSTNDSIYNSLETERIHRGPSILYDTPLPLTASRNPNTSFKRGHLLTPLHHSNTKHSTTTHLAVTHNANSTSKNNRRRRNFLLVPVR
ncbi:uncharacterized protein [Procambarus clarkii]|uniref:uncharacterized protein n=1 Tax=Procambarus clarkii TaxID=6728 RepID=UPI0037428643